MIPIMTTVFVKGDEKSFETFKRLFEEELENTLGKGVPYVVREGEEIISRGFCDAAGMRYAEAENTVKIFPHNLNSALTTSGLKPMPIPKFNIGDWVIVLDNVQPEWPNHRKAVGHVFPIRGDTGIDLDSFNKGTQVHPLDPENRHSINYHVSNIRHATDQEIRDHLWKEAQERGIKIGTTVKDVSIYPTTGVIFVAPTLVKSGNDCTLVSTGQFIYHHGNWATVVPENKTTSFFEHEISWNPDHELIEVGCQEFTKEHFYDMYRFMYNLTENIHTATSIIEVYEQMDKVKDWLESL